MKNVFYLEYRVPYDFEGLLAFYRIHPIGSCEWFDAESMYRVFECGGKAGLVQITNDSSQHRLRVECDHPDPEAKDEVLTRIRNLFDLDSDPFGIEKQLAGVKSLRPLLKRFPGTKTPSGWDPFEIGISTILGQLVSVARARQLVDDLVEQFGTDSGLTLGGRRAKFFPTPSRLADADLGQLGTTRVRKSTIHGFAKAVLKGDVSLDPEQDVDNFVESVLKLPGIGPWTAQYMALKMLRHTDAFPETDLIIKRALDLHPKETLEVVRPFRSYVATLFWREYASVFKEKK